MRMVAQFVGSYPDLIVENGTKLSNQQVLQVCPEISK